MLIIYNKNYTKNIWNFSTEVSKKYFFYYIKKCNIKFIVSKQSFWPGNAIS